MKCVNKFTNINTSINKHMPWIEIKYFTFTYQLYNICDTREATDQKKNQNVNL